MFGPGIAVGGVLWVLASVLVDTGRELTFRYVIFDPGHLAILVGVMVTIVSIPVAFQVAAAAPEDVELDLFELKEAEAEQPLDARPGIPAEWEAAE